MIYYLNASRNYNPDPKLESIKAPVLWINSADDYINPPELGIAEKMVKRIPHGRFILLPISDKLAGTERTRRPRCGRTTWPSSCGHMIRSPEESEAKAGAFRQSVARRSENCRLIVTRRVLSRRGFRQAVNRLIVTHPAVDHHGPHLRRFDSEIRRSFPPA